MTDPESPEYVDGLVRDTLLDRADGAPDGTGLLAAVHARSHRLRVRRRVRLAAAGAVAAVAMTIAVPQVVAGLRHPGPEAGPAATPATGEPATPSGSEAPASALTAAPSSASATATGGQPANALRLAAPEASPPVFPLRMASAGAWREPRVTLDGGVLTAFYEAHDPEGDADLSVVVSPGRPTFPTPAAPVTQTGRQVRGHAGTLRTVRYSPTAELTLYWQETADRWVQVRTDDTYRPEQVAQFAESLTAASLPVAVPLSLDLAPAGTVLDTATTSVLAWRPRNATTVALRCTLYQRRALRGTTVVAGGYRATIDRTGTGVTMEVDLTDADASLVIEVPAPYVISDADLIRLAATARTTTSAEPRTR